MDSVSSSTASPLLRLPHELLIAIASDLPYFDLRHLGMVCKRLRSIEEVHISSFDAVGAELTGRDHAPPQAPELQSTLFRRGPERRLCPGEPIELHPLLNIIDCSGKCLRRTHYACVPGRVAECFPPLNKRAKSNLASRHRSNAFDFAEIDDYATSPACDTMSLHMFGCYVSGLHGISGVTVRMVVQEALDYWITPHTDEKAQFFKSMIPIFGVGRASPTWTSSCRETPLSAASTRRRLRRMGRLSSEPPVPMPNLLFPFE